MLFNSLSFLLFLTLFFAVWPMSRRRQLTRYLHIVFASFTFYAFWNFRFVFLFIVIGCVDYYLALVMNKFPAQRRKWLIISITNTVGWLIIFKYSNFLASIFDAIPEVLHSDFRLRSHVPELMQVGPVGLSFYAFMSISYVVETYRGRIRPAANPLHYLAYLSFFPHLMCGPIIRPESLLRQLEEKTMSTESQRWEGMMLIASGYFKKVVIADNVAPIVNEAFASPFNQSGLYWWIIMILFSAQIYCDFSGYSDIARGIFKLMGYEIPVNFNHPYTSMDLRSFWQRWHISLSSWFRDYVYIPLGGSKTSAFGAAKNLWITFLLSGLWHGAAWHFVVWGALHAFFLSIERWLPWPSKLNRLRAGSVLRLSLTLLQVIVAWVFFRAQDVPQGLRIITAMFTPSISVPHLPAFVILAFSVLILREVYVFISSRGGIRFPIENYFVLREVIPALLLTISVYCRGPGNAFIYFQF